MGKIRKTFGDVNLIRCDAEQIHLKATTGSITANLLTPKSISAHATTGDVDVPQSNSGGACEIVTITGNILVDIG